MVNTIMHKHRNEVHQYVRTYHSKEIFERTPLLLTSRPSSHGKLAPPAKDEGQPIAAATAKDAPPSVDESKVIKVQSLQRKRIAQKQVAQMRQEKQQQEQAAAETNALKERETKVVKIQSLQRKRVAQRCADVPDA
jgi:hypothetical protein